MSNFMQRYGDVITRHPIIIAMFSIAVSLVAIFGAQHLRFTNDYRYFFTNDNPYLTAFEELERTYSSPDTLLFVYQPQDGSKAVSREALSLAHDLTTAGWQLPFSSRIDSVTNFQNTRAVGEDDLEVGDLVVDPASLTQDQLDYVEATILNEPLLAGRLLAHDARTAAVLVSMKAPRNDTVATEDIITKARALMAGYQSVRKLSEQEVNALPVLASGAAMRFLLTRLYDWLHQKPEALVTPKNPTDYLRRLRFHKNVTSPADYGLEI